MEIAWLLAWGHSQSLDKWSEHPPADYEYIVNVSEFLLYAGLETLFLGPKDKDSHTILFFTFRQNRTTACERRKYVPFPVKRERRRSRKKNRRQIDRRARPKALRRARARPNQRSKAKESKPASELWTQNSFTEEIWDSSVPGKASSVCPRHLHQDGKGSALASLRVGPYLDLSVSHREFAGQTCNMKVNLCLIEITMAVQSCCFAISPCTVHVTSLYITLLLLFSGF